MSPESEGDPRREAAPKGSTATVESQEHLTPTVGHDVYMRQLAARIRWLRRHRHWWLKTEAGRAQREFLDRRDAA